MPPTRRPGSTRDRRGFTLVELTVVILIIGLMMTFLLAASWEGLRRGQERATEALITKLDAALIDRYEALARMRPSPNEAHRHLARVAIPSEARYPASLERARLIARIDYLRRELPDVFFVQDDNNYPLNFAGTAFQPGEPFPNPNPVSLPSAYAPYVLPLGHGLISTGYYNDEDFFVSGGRSTWWGAGSPSGGPGGEGIFGASYSVIGALTRQLGYLEEGYNGLDDNGNGLVDELQEGTGGDASLEASIRNRLARHTHITARSEMLYATLVGGAGPLGSVFSPDDFNEREVRDTDGDGLLEFVDAWGNPLQFYRWPVYHTSDYGSSRSFQKGSEAYDDATAPREQNPLDPNQLLVAPGWWANLENMPADPTSASSSNMSSRAQLFQQHFFSIVDPLADLGTTGGVWDRTGYYKRRAYFFKPLIASAGADGRLGIGSFGLSYDPEPNPAPLPPFDASFTPDVFTQWLVLIENQADRSNPFARTATPGNVGLYQSLPTSDPATILMRTEWGNDDITNHSLGSPGGGVR